RTGHRRAKVWPSCMNPVLNLARPHVTPVVCLILIDHDVAEWHVVRNLSFWLAKRDHEPELPAMCPIPTVDIDRDIDQIQLVIQREPLRHLTMRELAHGRNHCANWSILENFDWGAGSKRSLHRNGVGLERPVGSPVINSNISLADANIMTW